MIAKAIGLGVEEVGNNCFTAGVSHNQILNLLLHQGFILEHNKFNYVILTNLYLYRLNWLQIKSNSSNTIIKLTAKMYGTEFGAGKSTEWCGVGLSSLHVVFRCLDGTPKRA